MDERIIRLITPEGFDELRAERIDYFRMRDTILEPTSLKKRLELYQYEGCFIFTYNNNIGKYIYLKSGYSDSDLTATLDESSINNLSVR